MTMETGARERIDSAVSEMMISEGLDGVLDAVAASLERHGRFVEIATFGSDSILPEIMRASMTLRAMRDLLVEDGTLHGRSAIVECRAALAELDRQSVGDEAFSARVWRVRDSLRRAIAEAPGMADSRLR